MQGVDFMKLRKAVLNDVDQILNIINLAKLYFKENHIDQWQNGYPNRDSIIEDIKNNVCCVICDEDKIIATAAVIDGVDPNYAIIEQGQWLSDYPYVCVHRVACLPDYKGKGIASKFLEYAKILGRNSVRIDTHEDNISMQKMILKNGFTYCGIVYMSDGAKRNAYEWVLNDFKTFVSLQQKLPYYRELKHKIDDEYEQITIYPPKKDIFRCMNLTTYEDVKVVILGQDPYHEPHQANGLAFSVYPGVKVPPSLVNIFKECQDDVNTTIPNHGDLTSWARQGVLLLNNVLTVREHQANSHRFYGWETFTLNTIKFLNERKTPMVFILWGKNAIEKEKYIDKSRHLVLKSVHPSPLSSYRGFFGSKPFSKTNAFLIKNHIQPINWQIEDIK